MKSRGEDFQVRNAEIEATLKDIGGRIRSALDGSGFGFALLIYSFGEKGTMFYTANGNRQDMCNAMREFIEKNEEKSNG